MSKRAEPHSRDQVIERELRGIYASADEAALTAFDIKRRSRLRTFLLIFIPFLFVATSIAWIGFIVFAPTPVFTGTRAQVAVRAPLAVAAGEQFEYEITFINREDTTLTNPLLTVRLPEGFQYVSASRDPIPPSENPTNTQLTQPLTIRSWRLPDVRPRESTSLLIAGSLITTPPATALISSSIYYVPKDFSSEFEVSGSATTEVRSGVIQIRADGPRQLADEERGTYTFRIKNNSLEPIDTVYLTAEYPTEFSLMGHLLETSFSEDTPPSIPGYRRPSGANQDVHEWTIPRISPGSEARLTIAGSFAVPETGERTITLTAHIPGPAETPVAITSAPITSEIIKGELVVRLIIEGSERDTPVNFGDTVDFLISVKNRSRNTVGGVIVRAVLDSPLLVWSTLTDQAGGTVSAPQILWTARNIPELNLILPESEVLIPFSMRLRSFAETPSSLSATSFKITSFVETRIGNIDNLETEKSIVTDPIINTLNSNMNADAYALYFNADGATLGSGPLPPIVGQTTSYQVNWRIMNSLHELSTIRFEAPLPDGVSFNGVTGVAAGTLYSEGQTVVWEINRMPRSVSELVASFSLSITPTSTDAEKILSILGATTITATDVETGSSLRATRTGLTTNLDRDPQGKDKGLVKKQE